ncbi:VOC family protein [Sphingomonas sp.]|uniref:VOC family protein n=1 Tax=Sphingomonas sp. TaxID=28214 RepID=UPI00286D7FD2|nr:VOC family protein [Sphingomonas sp.]
MIGYVTLGTDDLERARSFYDALLGTIGAKRLMQFADEDGGFTMYGTSMDRPALVVTRPYDKQPPDCGNGNMVALVMDTPDKVDAFYAKALELGATDEGPPGYRGDPKFGYYFGYFRDPDGHKLAAFNIARQGAGG